MKLITFSGVDGSGKSTQLALLREHLEQKGQKVFYFHAIEFSCANRISRFIRKKGSFTPGSEKAVTQASLFSLWLRKMFLFVDIIRFTCLMKRLETQKYDTILSDRYFYDSVLNLLYLASQHRNLASKDLWLESFIPQPDHAFFMEISAEAIMGRDRVPEQGIEYLKKKIDLFGEKKAYWNLMSLDASQPQQTLHQTVIEALSQPHSYRFNTVV